MRQVSNGPVPLLTWPCFDGTRVHAAVTTRAGGVSTGRYATLNLALHVGDTHDDVLTNRARAAVAFGARPDDLVFSRQVAGAAVAVVGAADRGRGAGSEAGALPGIDAMVTAEPGVVLAIMVADCAPIVLHDPVADLLACVHAGWQGVVRRVIGAALAEMVARGARPDRVVAAIGPAVSGETYQVGEDVVASVREAFDGRAGGLLRPDGTGRYLFDLVGACRRQLLDEGVEPGNIHPSGLVTGPGTPFFSHRGEGPCGRFAVLARLAGAAIGEEAA